HGNIIARQNYRAARANLLHPTDNARHFDAISNRDRSLRQNNQAADEIAGDVLQTETHTDSDRTGENSQRGKVNPRVFQDNEDANDQDDIADHLRDRVLEGTIEPTFGKKPVKKKPL